MKNRLSVSGSTIMSDPAQFEKLFWEGSEDVEIGEFDSQPSFDRFLKLCRKKNAIFGVHSPLFKNGSKYDLIEKVQVEPEHAWVQLEKEAEKLSQLGAEYILVHFPYFKSKKTETDPNKLIEYGLKRLHVIQEKYQISIVCEPKLGFQRSPDGIRYLHHFPEDTWRQYGLKLCIDIGDYLIATGKLAMEYISKWEKHIHVAHIHNVAFIGDKYIWTPVHPSYEGNLEHYELEPILRYLAGIGGIRFVFEHTPHLTPSDEFVEEGYQWVKSIIKDEMCRVR
ncbi:TIM barrel protein [Alkalihalobacillus sp. TS-13]|uniref:TIM barrel protein n=1 Tax=Alkalihalobacillus sp. TS-13 TaxID=2842455 RepID=UPI001C889A68|nr:TIM barrel protein [Alkalihalobacillus sp. TS-13]